MTSTEVLDISGGEAIPETTPEMIEEQVCEENMEKDFPTSRSLEKKYERTPDWEPNCEEATPKRRRLALRRSSRLREQMHSDSDEPSD